MRSDVSGTIDSPSLTVGCPSGLANRLRVLLTGIAWEQLTGRRFTLLWPRNAPCSAGFTDMFEYNQHVREADESEVMSLPAFGSYLFPPMFDISTAHEQHLSFRTSSSMVPPRLSPVVAKLSRLLPHPPAPFTRVHSTILERAAGMVDELRPLQFLRERIHDFQSRHFGPRMIGVHVRRGDFPLHRDDSNASLRRVLATVDKYTSSAPDAGILLASDDGAPDPYTQQPTTAEGVHSHFQSRFGDRVVSTTPRSIDRRLPEAVQDALIDLLLLRQTDFFVGTAVSSFSEFAIFGRNIPSTLCPAGNPRRWLWRLTLIEPIVVAAGVLQFGRLAPFSVLVDHHRKQWRGRFAGRRSL